MYCTYQDGTATPSTGVIKNTHGTFPLAWLNAVTPQQRADVDTYLFVDDSRAVPSGFYEPGVVSDAAPVDGVVVRSNVPVEKTIDNAKQHLKNSIETKYNTVLRGGLVFSVESKALSTSVETVSEVVVTLGRIDNGKALPENYKVSDLTGARIVMSEVNLRKYSDEIAEHFYSARKARDDHQDAVDALSAFTDVITYDSSTNWPTNPVV
jgi:hypothetical protein|tara:strand:- start:356 stop:982 length:627 start_codon:yes stop_codon:yes gene_type:complete